MAQHILPLTFISHKLQQLVSSTTDACEDNNKSSLIISIINIIFLEAQDEDLFTMEPSEDLMNRIYAVLIRVYEDLLIRRLRGSDDAGTTKTERDGQRSQSHVTDHIIRENKTFPSSSEEEEEDAVFTVCP
ncbi:hypothetical protein EYF80_059448 [Liparis tanakae]|uniref:Uncharacterized protein n=1 Tax=Liparis tanakae TaxID=230148 RepID=A0A4Z2EP87_9TELE|nr:hypothetical protein EYF80_059448 [Liparis tanakae]